MSKQTSWLQQRLESIWYQKKTSDLFFYLLLPLSSLFCFISQRRRKKLTQQQVKLDIPIIIVGNISIGGTGKTPLVLRLTELLINEGYKPAIITRGYKGTSQQWPLLVTPDTATQLAGDEAKLMAIRSKVPVIAGADRLADIQWVTQNTDCNIIISDDGLQHYQMPRDIEIVVIDAQRRFGNGKCLPAGPLREKTSRLKECDFLVSNGHPALDNESLMQVSGSYLVNLKTNEQKPITSFESVQIVTGIGNPQRFINTLASTGLYIIDKKLFADHHHYVEADFSNQFKNIATVMTEKDAVKCTQLELDNCWYLPVKAKLASDFENRFINKVSELF